VPRLSGVGGMVSFQHKLAAGLAKRGIQTCFDLAELPYQAVLVIGGTRHIGGLWKARRRGIPIIQRLDGMNWLHRVRTKQGERRTNLRHYLRAEYGNVLLSLIRARLADAIVYQSEFSRTWWERVHGPSSVPNKVIHNGVDLSVYTPEASHQRPTECYRLLLVEGSLMGGYEMGLEVAVKLASQVGDALRAAHSLPVVELMIAGRVSPELQDAWQRRLANQDGFKELQLNWAGLVSPERIPELDRSAHLLYSADVNAACPNSVIEAMACGLPVVAFDTGALPELVRDGAGKIIPYGGDPWRLEPPDVPALTQAAVEILQDQTAYRPAARARAEAAFSLDQMVESYLDIFEIG
jgi:glycosyltransferase involved in cell wall biosynthesis